MEEENITNLKDSTPQHVSNKNSKDDVINERNEDKKNDLVEEHLSKEQVEGEEKLDTSIQKTDEQVDDGFETGLEEGMDERTGLEEETEKRTKKRLDEGLDEQLEEGLEEDLKEGFEEEQKEATTNLAEVGEKKDEKKEVEKVEEEEEKYIEEPPPDPTAPYDLSDSKEALLPFFELRPEQLSEVEQLWDLFQNYTPAYTDIDNYITEKELIYMLKSLLLMTYTPEQLQELISYCVRPPHPQGYINYDQFLKIVKIRQRTLQIEDELRSALQILDPEKTGSVDREYLKEVLLKKGHKMAQRQLDNLIKEVDISNDGTIGIEDVVGTMCIDLNREDMLMLRSSIYPPGEENVDEP